MSDTCITPNRSSATHEWQYAGVQSHPVTRELCVMECCKHCYDIRVAQTTIPCGKCDGEAERRGWVLETVDKYGFQCALCRPCMIAALREDAAEMLGDAEALSLGVAAPCDQTPDD